MNFHSSVKWEFSIGNDGTGIGEFLEHDQWNYEDVFDEDEWEDICDDDIDEGLEKRGFTPQEGDLLRIWGGIEIERIDG